MLVDISAGISHLIAPAPPAPSPLPSFPFTSPEQREEGAPAMDMFGPPRVVDVGPRADIWGLGATLLHLKAKLPVVVQVPPPPLYHWRRAAVA